MVVVDGDQGEGGGQILRTALTLAMVAGRSVDMYNIRARRARPGLRRQHVAAVNAAQAISGARVEGAVVGSARLRFEPGMVRPGSYRFDVGTAGSACLVLQTVLPPLLTASGPSQLVLEGGTHNPMAPPFDYLDRVFLPLVRAMGPRATARLERHGFYPGGGGRFTVTIDPVPRLRALELVCAGPVQDRRARALLANLPDHIGERELRVVREQLGWDARVCRLERVEASGSGNALLLEVMREPASELVAGFGERGLAAERVAAAAAREMQEYLSAGVPVGRHLADQLVLLLALAGRGGFLTLPLSEHARTNIAIIEQFDVARIGVAERDGRALVDIAPVHA